MELVIICINFYLENTFSSRISPLIRSKKECLFFNAGSILIYQACMCGPFEFFSLEQGISKLCCWCRMSCKQFCWNTDTSVSLVIVCGYFQLKLQSSQKKPVTWPSQLISSMLLLLLLSHLSCVRLCATPQTAAHQTLPSLGFSRQGHWSGLPFPSPVHESEE